MFWDDPHATALRQAAHLSGRSYKAVLACESLAAVHDRRRGSVDAGRLARVQAYSYAHLFQPMKFVHHHAIDVESKTISDHKAVSPAQIKGDRLALCKRAPKILVHIVFCGCVWMESPRQQFPKIKALLPLTRYAHFRAGRYRHAVQ